MSAASKKEPTMPLNIHQFNNRRADILRHGESARAGLERTAVSQKLTTREIIDRAYEIGRRQAEDMVALEREAGGPAFTLEGYEAPVSPGIIPTIPR